jgi:hypothetical protein
MHKKPSHIKYYLKSKSPESLKVLMLKNNVEKQHYFDYQIIHDGSNWFAWYEWDSENLLMENNEANND